MHLELDFRWTSIGDISTIGKGIKDLKNMTTLRLSFGNCGAITDIAAIGDGMTELKQETARPLMVRITEKLVRLVRDGREPPQLWADPSAYSWIIYAVLKAGEEWCPFTVAFGYEWVDRDQSSFVVEAQGLDKGLQVLQFILDLSPQGVEQTV